MLGISYGNDFLCLTSFECAHIILSLFRVLEDSQTGRCIPTGDLHILSQTYLDNRRKAFVSQRADFVEENKEPVKYAHR